MYRVHTFLSSSNSMTFHDFLHDLFKSSTAMCSAVSFKNSKIFPCLRVFFDLKQFIRHKLWCPTNCALFNYPLYLYIVLPLSSAVTYLTHKTLIFHDFQGPRIKFHDFPGLDNQILKFHDFPGFP